MKKNIIILALSTLAIIFMINCLNPAKEGNLVPKTVMDDSSLPSKTINGVKLHFEDTKGLSSNEKIVIFLHGGPGFDYRSLIPIAEILKNNYKIILYDQRGSGLSQRLDLNNATLSVNAHVADLKTIRDLYFNVNENTTEMVIIGHSWGGALLQAFIAKYPNDLTHAIFMSSMPVESTKMNEVATLNPSLFSEAITDATWQRNFIGESSHAEMDYRYINITNMQSFYYCNANDVQDVPYWRFGYVTLFKTLENGMLSQPPSKSGMVFDYNFTASNKLFTGKVLTMSGACDKALGDVTSAAIKSSFSEASNKSAPNISISSGGHYFWITNFSDTSNAIKSFLGL